ncbi:MAG TPA: cytochrome c [Hyphomicrobiaceae bacterium]|nr:cytochrome c [Hyphomicrobiaceae bacterium]
MLLRNLSAGALAAVVATALSFGAADSQTASSKPRYGKPISEADIAAWNIDIRTSDGKGLPKGKGSVAEGKELYAQQCVACHGDNAKGGSMYGPMVGGIGSFKTNARVLTPGSMYPYAPILFDYIRRTMPMTAPQTLTDDQVYALAAYILNLNGLVPENAVMDAESLTKVAMPNRNGFIVDNRPDTKAKRCMTNC